MTEVFWFSRNGLQIAAYDETLKAYVTRAAQTPLAKEQVASHILPRVSGDLKKAVEAHVDRLAIRGLEP